MDGKADKMFKYGKQSIDPTSQNRRHISNSMKVENFHALKNWKYAADIHNR
jgi:hypothetical protein